MAVNPENRSKIDLDGQKIPFETVRSDQQSDQKEADQSRRSRETELSKAVWRVRIAQGQERNAGERRTL